MVLTGQRPSPNPKPNPNPNPNPNSNPNPNPYPQVLTGQRAVSEDGLHLRQHIEARVRESRLGVPLGVLG